MDSGLAGAAGIIASKILHIPSSRSDTHRERAFEERSEFEADFRLMGTALERKPFPSSALEGEAEAAE